MKHIKFSARVSRLAWMMGAALLAAVGAPDASAQTLTTLVSFDGDKGSVPSASLVADANGNLFGIATQGGAYGYGTVFEIVKTAAGYASTPTVLVTFDGTNGIGPAGHLIVDANGNLFGMTTGGGAYGYGTVFEIVKTAGGYADTPTVLVSFDGINNMIPVGGLIADANGNLFGRTRWGGAYGWGTVFEIVKTAGGYASTLTILASFDDNDAFDQSSGLSIDANGNLFGTMAPSWAYGAVFEIVKTAGGYASTLTILASFDDIHGADPRSGLIVDANGNLFGTTRAGGTFGYGTVFEIVKTAGGYASVPIVLANFDQTHGASPVAGLIADPNGNLFGTTPDGGAYGYGTVFKIVKTAGEYASTPTILFSFDQTHGTSPVAGLIADANGNLFGTTPYGGAYGYGTVFMLALPKAQVTISSNSTGRTFSVLGAGCEPGSYTAPQNFSWLPGTSCIINFAPIQNGTAGTQYVFKDWSDGDTAISRTITAPSGTATYTANFKTQYELTSSVSPASSGSVTGAGYYDAGSTATVVASPNAGNQFLNWTGPVASPSNASTTVTMNAPLMVTANFQLRNTITFNAIPAQTVGASVNLSTYASASSGLPVSFASLTTSICTVSGTTSSMISAGTCTIQASQAGNGTYAPATPVSGNITISAAAVPNFTIKANPPNQTAFRDVLAGFLLELKSVNGFNGNVSLSCAGGPVGAKCANLPQTVRVNGTAYAISGMIFPKSTKPGTYTVTFTGVAASLTNTATASFTVK